MLRKISIYLLILFSIIFFTSCTSTELQATAGGGIIAGGVTYLATGGDKEATAIATGVGALVGAAVGNGLSEEQESYEDKENGYQEKISESRVNQGIHTKNIEVLEKENQLLGTKVQ